MHGTNLSFRRETASLRNRVWRRKPSRAGLRRGGRRGRDEEEKEEEETEEEKPRRVHGDQSGVTIDRGGSRKEGIGGGGIERGGEEEGETAFWDESEVRLD